MRFISTLSILLLAPLGAQAVDCELYCEALQQRAAEQCRDRACLSRLADSLELCIEAQCAPEPAPDDATLEAIARRKAVDLLGARIQLVEAQDHLAEDDSLRSRVYVFTRLSRTPSRAARVSSATRRADVQSYACVEVGLRPELPPVMGYWKGLSAEYHIEADARAATGARGGPVKRYGNGIFPMLVFRDASGLIAYDSASRRTTRNLAPRPRPLQPQRELARRQQFKRHWVRAIQQVER